MTKHTRVPRLAPAHLATDMAGELGAGLGPRAGRHARLTLPLVVLPMAVQIHLVSEPAGTGLTPLQARSQ